MTRLLLVLVLTLVVGWAAAGDDWDATRHMSTHTMYQPPTGSNRAPPASCEPVQVNLVARHGARFPGKSDIRRYGDLQLKMQEYAHLYNAPYAWMGTWTNPYYELENDLLTYSGQLEHYNLAQRMLKQFTAPMQQPYQPYTYEFQSTAVSRAGRSGNAFGYSLFQARGAVPYPSGQYAPFFIYSESMDQDVELRFFDVCPEYVYSVDENVTAIEQANIYEANQVAAAALALSEQIGVSSQWNISTAEIELMYKGCGYDLAVNNITNHFCTLFTDEEIGNAMEYWSDLVDYWQKGYGHEVNYKIACRLLQDIFAVHQAFVDGENTNLRGKFRFAHAETIMPLVAILGLYQDSTPLMANWTAQQQAQRKWRTSDISPFAANVQFALFRCDEGDHKIQVLVNEVPQVLPGCTDTFCDFETVVQQFSEDLACPYDEMCFQGQSVCEYYCG